MCILPGLMAEKGQLWPQLLQEGRSIVACSSDFSGEIRSQVYVKSLIFKYRQPI